MFSVLLADKRTTNKGDGMGWDITVKSPFEGIEINEPISAVSSCPGNFYSSIIQLHGEQLRHMEPDDAIEALCSLIIELDKGDAGLFNDAYFVGADRQWSNGRETAEAYDSIKDFSDRIPYAKTYESYTGHTRRAQVRADAQRFLTYYASGCTISYDW